MAALIEFQLPILVVAILMPAQGQERHKLLPLAAAKGTTVMSLYRVAASPPAATSKLCVGQGPGSSPLLLHKEKKWNFLSGSRRPTLLRCSFHPLTHFGTNPSPPFLQTCPFLPLTSTRPCRRRGLGGKRCFGCRHPYRGGRSTPFVEFCRPPFGARCRRTRLRQDCISSRY